PYTLGELNVWTETSLMEWTQRDVGVDRLHVHLVCDLVAGVSALLSLSAAPTERWVLDSLSPGRKTLGLTFQLRSNRIVDVVLIDAAEPMTHATSLMRAPSLLLFCPPRGSLLSLGTGARFELEMLIESVRPRAVVGLGNPTLSQIDAFRKKRSSFRFIAGDFAEGQDLRGLLIEGVRHWASTDESPDATSPTNGD
ncbi:MAG TPA: hypothetical protein VM925_22920, partial [Labilithrix sp.]|nr:hypothetical protein [Labilithrix sp.]